MTEFQKMIQQLAIDQTEKALASAEHAAARVIEQIQMTTGASAYVSRLERYRFDVTIGLKHVVESQGIHLGIVSYSRWEGDWTRSVIFARENATEACPDRIDFELV